MTRTTIAMTALLSLAIAGCSQQPDSAQSDSAQSGTAEPAVATSTSPAQAASSPSASTPAEPAPAPVAGRTYRYTSLEGCKVIRKQREEMPMTEVECAGPGIFDVRILDADARQSMTLVDPGGTLHRLNTSPIDAGAFSSFGKTAEWRGKDGSGEAGSHFESDSMIVRFDYAQQPHPAPERSDLLVIRLGRTPCILSAVPPGPGQNDSARRIADSGRSCPAA